MGRRAKVVSKLIVIVVILLVMTQLVRPYAATAQSAKKKVLTTFTVIADMAANVAGDKVDVESITKPGAEIHHYEPTPSDIVRALNSDLILDSGLGLETWAERFYANVPNVPHVTLTTGITPIIISGGPFDGKPNPHAWMSPANALIYVENIRKALTDLDPADTATFSANAQSYSDQIRAVDQYLKQALAVLPQNERILVTCEGAFSYLAHDYGMGELYLWAVNSDQEGTPQQIKHVIDGVTANHIPAVFCESTVNNKAQLTVAAQTGARFGGVLYVDSLTGPDGPAPTYLKMLTVNAQTIITGLLGEAAPPLPTLEATEGAEATSAATMEATGVATPSANQ